MCVIFFITMSKKKNYLKSIFLLNIDIELKQPTLQLQPGTHSRLTAAQSSHASVTMETTIRCHMSRQVRKGNPLRSQICLSGPGFNLVVSDTSDPVCLPPQSEAASLSILYNLHFFLTFATASPCLPSPLCNLIPLNLGESIWHVYYSQGILPFVWQIKKWVTAKACIVVQSNELVCYYSNYDKYSTRYAFGKRIVPPYASSCRGKTIFSFVLKQGSVTPTPQDPFTSL